MKQEGFLLWNILARKPVPCIHAMACLKSFGNLCSVNYPNMFFKHVENVLLLLLTFVIFHPICLQLIRDSFLCFINSFILLDKVDSKRTMKLKWYSLFTSWSEVLVHWWRIFWCFIALFLLTLEGSGFCSVSLKISWYVTCVRFEHIHVHLYCTRLLCTLVDVVCLTFYCELYSWLRLAWIDWLFQEL